MGSAHRFGEAWLAGPPDQPISRLRVRVQVLLATLLILTNVIGAVVAFGLTSLVTPGGGLSSRHLVALAIAVPVYVAAVVVGVAAVTVSALRALPWVLEDRDPSPQGRRTALRLPWRMTLIQAGLWISAVVIFTSSPRSPNPRHG